MKPKYSIGVIVCMEDSFNFNPADEALSIGKVEAIHIIRGKGLCKKKNDNGEWIYPDNRRILYTVSGFSLIPEEKQLRRYRGSCFN
jgi:hypothetical protein